MQQANSVDAALECDVLVSRVFASALNRGHEQALRNMDALIQAIEGTSILLINEPRAHAYEIDKFASTAALHEAGISTPRIYDKGTPQELAAEDENHVLLSLRDQARLQWPHGRYRNRAKRARSA